jgi:hypothetical protein
MNANTADRARNGPRAIASAVTAMMLALLPMGASGRLVAHFHVTRAVAAVIVNLIVSGGFWTLAVLYPFIVPAEITLQTLIKLFGVTYAIGW